MSSGRSAMVSRLRSRVVKSAMASQQSAPSAGSTPSDQVVGNAFVHQYYHILHQSPELVYRFYQEGSKLGRPDPQGVMSSVTTMQTINEKILSMDYSEFRAEIKTVDAQESLEGGVLVLVTGYFTGKDNVRRNFTQSFFLATQDKGYYVLNDILRYVEDADHLPVNQVPANSTGATHSPKHKNLPPQEQQLLPPEEEEAAVVREEALVVEVINEVPSSSSPLVAESSSVTAVREEEPKKSSALIVEVKKETTTPLSVLAPAAARPPHANPERQATTAPTPAPAPEAPAASLNFTETSSVQEPEVDSHSVYIKNLPLNATPTQLEEEFQKFGPIKPGGIQVRSHKQEGFCFGFVEFEVACAVQSAIEASPVMIGGRQAYVEEKRPTGSRVMESQTNKGKEKVHAEPTMKVIWDAEATAIFIELCVEQVRTGNKPHTHFNKVGWNSIVRLFNEKTNRKYNQVQLKNKWDNLKKDWVLWQSLNRGETGIGWSASKETIEAPNSWWELKLQRHPDAAKFRDKGLAHETLLNICFSDVTTGEHAWTSASGVLPPHMQSPEVGDDDDLEYLSATDDSVPVVRVTRDDGHSQRKHQNDQSGGRKLRKVGGATKLSRTLDRIVTAVESSTATTARDAPCCTIKDCLDAMDVTPGVERGTPLFIIGARLFLSQVHREMFIQLGDDKTRLQYLLYEQQRRQQLQQSRHQRSDNPPS